MNTFLRGLAAAVVALVLSACFVTRTMLGVDEVREFPDYGGWLPVYSDGRVQECLVRPEEIDERRERWFAPATRDEALRRIDVHGRDIVLLPIGGAYFCAVLPVTLAMVPLLFFLSTPKPPAPTPYDLEQATRIELDVRVVDPRGAPLGGAFVVEVPVVQQFASWREGERRFFGAPVAEPWLVSERVVQVAERQFEPDFGLRTSLEVGDDRIYAREPVRRATSPSAVADSEGHASFQSSAAMSWVEADGERNWRWKSEPTEPLTRVVAWAPGFAPRLVDAPHVEPGGRCAMSIALEPIADGERIRGEHRRWTTAYAVLGQDIGKPWCFLEDSATTGALEFERLALGRAVLLAMSADDSLPPWMRHNIALALRSYVDFEEQLYDYEGNWGLGDERALPLRDELRELRERLAHEPLPGWASIGDSPQTVDGFQRDVDVWVERVRDLDGMGFVEQHVRRDDVLAEARELVERGEALDPDWPLVGMPRAAVALAAGDRKTAQLHARLLDNRAYVSLFHLRW